MKALILAGGLGTRLRPLTYSTPKPLLPIANRPHITHVFDLLRAAGINEAVLLTSYLASEFDEVADDARAAGMRVEVSQEKEPLGTAGALKNAERFVGDGAFVVFNGDILTGTDIGGLIGFHRERNAVATILLTPVEDPSAFGVVPTDERGRILAFVEKPTREEAPSNLINAGVYVMEPEVLDRIPAEEVWSAERQLFPQLVEEGAGFYALSTDGYWIDVGTPTTYLQANLDAVSGRFSTGVLGDVVGEGVLIAPQAKVAENARVSSVVVGAGAEISSAAEVSRSVLFPGATVGSDARIVDSIIGDGARVDDGVRLQGAVIGAAEVVGKDGSR